tara:strand:+ start:156 stop:1058 length:903 start_codon:yes stop_codon:yes gene_type:complete
MNRIILLISLFLTISLHAQIVDCSELFFSEYVEGYGQNKAIEIYNPTAFPIDLSGYQVERYSNGATNSSAGGITSLSGILASGDVFVLTNGDTDTAGQFGYCDMALYNMGDMAEPNGSYPTPMHMNGNDAMVLIKDGNILDVIGRVGEDPASGAWTDDAASGFTMGTWWTANHTLIRKSNVLHGDNNGLDLFNPSLEWDSLPVSTWNNLGSHSCSCTGAANIEEIKNSYVVYPNPAIVGSIVSVESTQKITEIQITNLLGEMILTSNKHTINTNNLAQGAYLISIRFVDGRKADNKLIIE